MPKQWIDYGRGSSTAAQDEGQVSEDLVASAFQFYTPLAAVFAEEIGDFGVGAHDGYI
jgi:hypothetical protein